MLAQKANDQFVEKAQHGEEAHWEEASQAVEEEAAVETLLEEFSQ